MEEPGIAMGQNPRMAETVNRQPFDALKNDITTLLRLSQLPQTKTTINPVGEDKQSRNQKHIHPPDSADVPVDFSCRGHRCFLESKNGSLSHLYPMILPYSRVSLDRKSTRLNSSHSS